jgi:hypothetical protein
MSTRSFPQRGIWQKYTVGVFRSAEYGKSTLLAFSAARNIKKVDCWRFPQRGILKKSTVGVFRSAEY